MNINELNKDYLNEFLDKLSKENETIYLLGDLTLACQTMIFILPLMIS